MTSAKGKVLRMYLCPNSHYTAIIAERGVAIADINTDTVHRTPHQPTHALLGFQQFEEGRSSPTTCHTDISTSVVKARRLKNLSSYIDLHS